MLIYNKDNIAIDMNLEVVPCILTFNIYGKDYTYTLSGDNLENCPYNSQIQDWFIANDDCLTEIVWEWNTNKPEYSKIEVPLKI
ncbi:MAG: hypothetical protein II625_07470 [Bacilli bacterium]|nr:hypothetical protein [Bacilli bacterium]